MGAALLGQPEDEPRLPALAQVCTQLSPIAAELVPVISQHVVVLSCLPPAAAAVQAALRAGRRMLRQLPPR